MTVQSTVRKAGPTTGNGAATAYPFAFKVFVRTDVVAVLLTTATGVQQSLVLDSDYSVVLNADQNNNPGGTVTYPLIGSPMPATQKLTLTSALTNTQDQSIPNPSGFLPEVVEAGLDREVILVQQLALLVANSMRYPLSDPTLNAELPAAAQRAGMVLGFDASGNAIAVSAVTSALVSSFITPFLLSPNATAAFTNLGASANGAALIQAANYAAMLVLLGGAPLASPALTGNPTAPTQAQNDNSTKLATTAYVDRVQTGRLLARTYYTCQSHALTSISNGTPGVCTSPTSYQRPANDSPVRLTTSGGLPAPFVVGTTYWVVNSTGTTFNLALTKGGAAINTTTAGSGTHTINSAPYVKATNNPTFIEVEVQGAGGGGGGGSAAGITTSGGGAGGYSKEIILASALAASETVTVGAYGLVGANTGTNGGTGGTSSFGTSPFLSATGGVGGNGNVTSAGRVGVAGGVGSGGDLNLTGAPSAPSLVISSNSSASNGAQSMFGGSGLAPGPLATASGAGDAANWSGSGGSGCNPQGAAAQIGGAGGGGIVIVSEYA